MDITHQYAHIHQSCLFLQTHKMLSRNIQHILHVLRGFEQEEIAQIPCKIYHELRQFPACHDDGLDLAHDPRYVLCQQTAQQRGKHLGVHSPENGKHLVVGQRPVRVKGNALIQQRQRIPHRPIRASGNVVQPLFLDLMPV